MTLNTYAAVSGIAQTAQDDAIFTLRDLGTMQNLVTVLTDMTGLNTRTGYQYNSTTAKDIGEADDLTSDAFTPSADQVLTPSEIGNQFFITDSRLESDLPENLRVDANTELGMSALDKVESDLVSEMANLTGGTIGAAGTTITWGYLSAAIARARNANKSPDKPLVAVIHGYQWEVLASSATIAGASIAATAPGFQEEITRFGGSVRRVATFSGVPIFQVFRGVDSDDDFTGGVFPREAIAIDWRRMIRIESERDASRRGFELNMSAVYAHGVWRPDRGVQMIFDATAPTS